MSHHRTPIVTGDARIVGFGETPCERRPADGTTTRSLLTEACALALEDAGISPLEVDGLGVSSFSLAPDKAVDFASRLGLRCRWLMDGGNGGASAIDMLQHAWRAVAAGDARTVLLVAGDYLDNAAFGRLVADYNVATREHLAPIPTGGPNAVFAMLTLRHMRKHGLTRETYGRLAVAQREWARGNPLAAFRTPLTLTDYLEAPMVSDPLCRYDCVPVVAGASAVVVSSDSGNRNVGIRVIVGRYGDATVRDEGLETGLAEAASDLWSRAGTTRDEIDVVSVYDDYPVMALVQLADLGFAPDGDVDELVSRIEDRSLPVNTGGGQLSAGQAGSAGGMLGLVEVVRQLSGAGGARQVPDAQLGLVSGFGMITYRFGACANAAILEAS
jgi:acetyl-CoA acetyltransferase